MVVPTDAADLAHAARLADQGLTFGPPPPWVIEREVPALPATDERAVQYLLADAQVDLVGERARSVRLVQRAAKHDGVSRVAHLSFSYDPSWARAVVHRVTVHRGDQRIDHARSDLFQLLRRETRIEWRMYDGALTADLQIPDVRPGDVVDTWYTVFGAQPLTERAFQERYPFAWNEPVAARWVRVRAPRDRPLVARTEPEAWSGPEVSEVAGEDGVVDRAWFGDRVPSFRYEDAVPGDWLGSARLVVADVMTFGDVAALIRGGYDAPPELPADLDALCVAIADRHPDAAERTVAALRMVQRDVRYLSTTFGTGGLAPRPVADVWATRYGDCKDVSRLLAAVLRRLGVDASCALVHTTAGGRLPGAVPGLGCFDHALVRVRIADRTWWVDGTSAEQGGDLARKVQPWTPWALPLVPDAVLERCGSDDVVDLKSVRETFRLEAPPTGACRLEVVTEYRQWSADEMRGSLRREGAAAMAEHWTRHYARSYSGAESEGAPEFTDDLDANVLTVVERYRLAKPWAVENGVATFLTVDDAFKPDLPVIPDAARTQPLHLGRPRRITRTTVLELPRDWKPGGWNDAFDVPGLRASTRLEAANPRRFEHVVDYAITSSQIGVADLAAFRDALIATRAGASVRLTRVLDPDNHPAEQERRRLVLWRLVMSMAVVGYLAMTYARCPG